MPFVQSAIRTLVTAQLSTTVGPLTVTAANQLWLLTVVYNANGAAITISGGGTWTQRASRAGVGDANYAVFIHQCDAPTGGSTTVTIDPEGASADIAAVLIEWSELGAFDVSATNFGNSATPNVSSGALAQADEVIFAIAAVEGTATYDDTVDDTYTHRAESETDPGYKAQTKTVTSTASDQADWTIGAAGNWIAALATVRVSAAAPGGGGRLHISRGRPAPFKPGGAR